MSKTLLTTILALMAFAANSVLARLALETPAIDPASFTFIRLLSGAVMLFILVLIIRPKLPARPQAAKASNKHTQKTSLYEMALNYTFEVKGSWTSGFMLFLYAACFSFAYVNLDTATGALVLFAAVQISMIASSLLAGNRLHISEWIGIMVAFSGFVYLIYPDLNTATASSNLFSLLLMIIAGVAWGIYTLRGRNSAEPLTDTAFNFLRAISFAGALLILTLSNLHISNDGILYAVISGAITSGIGYAIWYIALRGLALTAAAVVQLSVPVVAAFGGLVFVDETITVRLMTAAVFILGGIFITIIGRYLAHKHSASGKL